MTELITLAFQAYTNFGKCDSCDWELDFEVTQEEYLRLVEAAKEYYYDFCDADEVSDIYERVYEAAVEQSTQDFLDNDPEMIEEYLEEGQTLKDWRADEVYIIGVNFPAEFEDFLEDEE